MKIQVTDKFVSIEGDRRRQRYFVTHIRNVSVYSRTRKYKNKEYEEWEKSSAGLLGIAGLIFIFSLGLAFYFESQAVGVGAFLIAIAIVLFTMDKKYFQKPDQYHFYDIHIAEFSSGDEVLGVVSRSKAAIDDFAEKISDAQKGEIHGIYNITIDRSITTDSTIIENLDNETGATMNFFEGLAVRDSLFTDEEKDDDKNR